MPNLGVKTSRVLIASGAYAAQQYSAIQMDMDAVALRLYLTVTAVSGTGGLLVVVRGMDRVALQAAGLMPLNPGVPTINSGNVGTVELTTGGLYAVTQTGTYAYEMTYYPSDAFGNIREAVSRAVPWLWDATVKVGDGSSYTYSLSAEILK